VNAYILWSFIVFLADSCYSYFCKIKQLRYNYKEGLIATPVFAVDDRCDNLQSPPNGSILSCSSGRAGVGYEGDTCGFACDTGYELTGSDNRTCQSDGSWSGRDTLCSGIGKQH